MHSIDTLNARMQAVRDEHYASHADWLALENRATRARADMAATLRQAANEAWQRYQTVQDAYWTAENELRALNAHRASSSDGYYISRYARLVAEAEAALGVIVREAA